MKDKIRKAIGYVRVSTEEQSKDGKFGIEVQTEGIKNYCRENNIFLQKIVVEKGSGAKERPLMNELVFGADTTNPPFDLIVVFKNDRIARDMKLFFYYKYVLEKKCIKLECVQDQFSNGIEAPIANLYDSMMQFVAEQERKNITMRTSSGRIAKAKKGGYAGGNIPYGYEAIEHKLEINQSEAKVVKLIFETYDNTDKVSESVKAVNELGYVSRNGKEFSYFTVRSILSNRMFYEGLYRYGELGYVKGEHQPILETSTNIFEHEEERIQKEIELEEKGEIYDGTKAKNLQSW